MAIPQFGGPGCAIRASGRGVNTVRPGGILHLYQFGKSGLESSGRWKEVMQ